MKRRSFALTLVVLVGCGADAQPPRVVGEPALLLDPTGKTPLAAQLDVTTDKNTTLSFDVTDGERHRTVLADKKLAKTHSAAVLGLWPDRRITVTPSVRDASGNVTQLPPMTVDTEPLPADFPPIEVLQNDPLRMQPGVTIFGATKAAAPGGQPVGYVIALDENGDVVWFYEPEQPVSDLRRIANGNLLYLYGNFDASEVDMLGNVAQRWHASGIKAQGPAGAINVPTDTFHHEIFEMPNGHLLVLSTEARSFADYPTSETNPAAPTATADVIGDVVIEMDRDGQIIGKWSLFDLLDPRRIGYDSLGAFWNTTYAHLTGGTRDWTHANAVIYDAVNDSILVSVRHQDAVIAFGRVSGKLEWIMGPHDNWSSTYASALLTPVGALEWQYHQHAPMLTDSGGLLLFDNGNFRASPFVAKVSAAANASRAVEFRIDRSAKTVEQVWSYGGVGSSDVFYSPFICDADELQPTGNVLITDGGRNVDPMTGAPSDNVATGLKFARLLEVTSGGEKVFEVLMKDKGTPPASWNVYRAERLSLYP